MTRPPKPVPADHQRKICKLHDSGLGPRKIQQDPDLKIYHPSHITRLVKKCPELMKSAGGVHAIVNAVMPSYALANRTSSPIVLRTAPSHPIAKRSVQKSSPIRRRQHKAQTPVKDVSAPNSVNVAAAVQPQPPLPPVRTYMPQISAPFANDWADDGDVDDVDDGEYDEDDEAEAPLAFNNYPNQNTLTPTYLPGSILATIPLTLLKMTEQDIAFNMLNEFSNNLQKQHTQLFSPTATTTISESNLSKKDQDTLRDIKAYLDEQDKLIAREKTKNQNEEAVKSACTLPQTAPHDSFTAHLSPANETSPYPNLDLKDGDRRSSENIAVDTQQPMIVGTASSVTGNEIPHSGSIPKPPEPILEEKIAADRISSTPPTFETNSKDNKNATNVESTASQVRPQTVEHEYAPAEAVILTLVRNPTNNPPADTSIKQDLAMTPSELLNASFDDSKAADPHHHKAESKIIIEQGVASPIRSISLESTLTTPTNLEPPQPTNEAKRHLPNTAELKSTPMPSQGEAELESHGQLRNGDTQSHFVPCSIEQKVSKTDLVPHDGLLDQVKPILKADVVSTCSLGKTEAAALQDDGDVPTWFKALLVALGVTVTAALLWKLYNDYKSRSVASCTDDCQHANDPDSVALF